MEFPLMVLKRTALKIVDFKLCDLMKIQTTNALPSSDINDKPISHVVNGI